MNNNPEINEVIKEILPDCWKLRDDGDIKASGHFPSDYEYNMLRNYADYIDLFVDGKPFPPFEIEIQMSSNCNFRCTWCIGDSVQKQKKIKGLSNFLSRENVDKLVDGIIDFRQNGLKIQMVKFSGFIGEPLIQKEATISAIQRLAGAGFKVGLFTNGVFMKEDTWDTLAHIYYVNLSLDGGPYSFFWLKEFPRNTDLTFTKKTFNTVIENIGGLNRVKEERNTPVNITVSYVVVPGNHNEIYEVTKLVKEAGANGIRFKCDIGGRHKLKLKDEGDESTLDEAYDQIQKAKTDLNDETFKVIEVHTKDDARDETYNKWDCKNGCFYQDFVATVGSDGDLYLCDHNTMPGAIPFGNVINESLQEVWESNKRKRLLEIIPDICVCEVCPPFANRANFFLKKIYDAKGKYGADQVKEALQQLRDRLNRSRVQP